MSSIRSPTQDLSPRNPKSQPVLGSFLRTEGHPPQAAGIIPRHAGIGYGDLLDLNGHGPVGGYVYRSGTNAILPYLGFMAKQEDLGHGLG